ncbi:hypothetical protein AAHC03_016357 [Spirometra sp. Aus1]
MLPFLRPPRVASADAPNSRFVELAASTVILSTLILLSGILTTSVAREHADRRIQHARASDVDKMSASAIRAESAAEDRHPDTPYLSSSRAGGFVGDVALSDSDVRSLLAQYDNGESGPSRIWTTNILSDSNGHIETRTFQDGLEEKENRISNNPTRSEGSTLRNIL